MSSKGRLGDPWYWDTELLEWEWVLEIKEALGWREQLAREEAKKDICHRYYPLSRPFVHYNRPHLHDGFHLFYAFRII